MLKVEVKQEESEESSITVDEAWKLQLAEKEEVEPLPPTEVVKLEDELSPAEEVKLEEDELPPAEVVKVEEDELPPAEVDPEPIELVVLPASTLTLVKLHKTRRLDPDKFQPSVTPSANGEILQHEHLDEPLVNQNRLSVSKTVNPENKKLPAYKCILCKSSFCGKKSLDKHILQHKKPNGKFYPCKHCKKRYRTVATLVIHLRKCDEEQGPFICHSCGKAFQHSCALARHKKSFHCKVCSIAFNTIALRTAHEKQQHRKNFPCTHCRRRFFTEEQLLDHMNATRGINTHTCYFCGKLFLYKSGLLKHIKACLYRAFPCDKCGKKFTSANQLQDHRQKIHQLERLFGCNCCPEAFKSKEEHEVHMRRHTDLQAFYCDFCIRWFLNKGTFEQHKTRAHKVTFKRCKTEVQEGTYGQSKAKSKKKSQKQQQDQKYFPCPCCKECFLTNEKLLDHLIFQHEGINTHSCYFCGKLFLQKSLLLPHLKSCIGKVFPCDECGETFATMTTVQEHRQNIHRLKKLFACNFCPEAFKSKQEHEAHLKVHTDLQPYYCDICIKWYLRVGSYKHHKSEFHEGLCKKGSKKKRFPCSHCSKHFVTKERLLNHVNAYKKISTHSCYFCGALFLYKSTVLNHLKKCPDKSFPCDQCEESFTLSSALQSHRQQIHQSERLFECIACPKVFKYIQEHEMHLRVHTDLKPLYCDMCNRWFLHKGSLKAHKTKCHLS